MGAVEVLRFHHSVVVCLSSSGELEIHSRETHPHQLRQETTSSPGTTTPSRITTPSPSRWRSRHRTRHAEPSCYPVPGSGFSDHPLAAVLPRPAPSRCTGSRIPDRAPARKGSGHVHVRLGIAPTTRAEGGLDRPPGAAASSGVSGQPKQCKSRVPEDRGLRRLPPAAPRRCRRPHSRGFRVAGPSQCEPGRRRHRLLPMGRRTGVLLRGRRRASGRRTRPAEVERGGWRTRPAGYMVKDGHPSRGRVPCQWSLQPEA
jgi:hypothetical protein